jgi:hypothetical protein
MIAYVLVYTFLAILMGAALYVVGTPWFTPKPRQDGRGKSRKGPRKAHG